MGQLDYKNKIGSEDYVQFLVGADSRQRELVGFPGVEHEYWKDPEMVEAVGNRYPDMDMRSYGGAPPKSQANGK